MRREIIADISPGQVRAAVMEDGKLVEYYVERPGSERPAGNIYKGRVVNVLPGMDAAFVDIGLEKNAFRYVGDVALNRDDFEFKSQGNAQLPDIRDVVKQGQELTEQEVIDHCNAHMAAFKSPKRVKFVDALPKNPSGKLLKRELRKTFVE